MPDYDRSNWAFLEEVGISASLEFLETPVVMIGNFEAIDRLIHQYAKTLTGGLISDRGLPHTYTPPTQIVSLDSREKLSFEVEAFRPLRVEFSVDECDYACVSFPTYAHQLSWSPGSVGSALSWSQALPETLQAKAVFIVTSTVAGQFVMDVYDTVEDPEDCDADFLNKDIEPRKFEFGEPTNYLQPKVDDFEMWQQYSSKTLWRKWNFGRFRN